MRSLRMAPAPPDSADSLARFRHAQQEVRGVPAGSSKRSGQREAEVLVLHSILAFTDSVATAFATTRGPQRPPSRGAIAEMIRPRSTGHSGRAEHVATLRKARGNAIVVLQQKSGRPSPLGADDRGLAPPVPALPRPPTTAALSDACCEIGIILSIQVSPLSDCAAAAAAARTTAAYSAATRAPSADLAISNDSVTPSGGGTALPTAW